jgi:hypothetical protein
VNHGRPDPDDMNESFMSSDEVKESFTTSPLPGAGTAGRQTVACSTSVSMNAVVSGSGTARV